MTCEGFKAVSQVWEFCPSCMQEHFVFTVEGLEKQTFKKCKVTSLCKYKCCVITREFWEDEKLMRENKGRLVEAYNKLKDAK